MRYLKDKTGRKCPSARGVVYRRQRLSKLRYE